MFSKSVLCIMEDVMFVQVLHDVAGNYVFEHFAGDGCERYWAVVDGL